MPSSSLMLLGVISLAMMAVDSSKRNLVVSSSEVIGLIGDIAWPITVLLILVILRREFEAILQALQKRIGDPHTPVKLTTQGLELSSRVEALEGTVETQQLKADVLAGAVAATRANPREDETIPQALLALRAEYIAASDERDHARRIQIKNDLARSMGAEVLRTNVDREALVDQRDEVMTLALAAAVTALPQPGDDVLILTAGRKVRRLHVRYRIAAAVSELAQSRNIQLNLLPDMEDLVSSYRKSADDRLIRRINWTLQVLKDYGEKGPGK